MKLPISFGNKLFFRVVLPGSVLTAAPAKSLPGASPALRTFGLPLLNQNDIISGRLTQR